MAGLTSFLTKPLTDETDKWAPSSNANRPCIGSYIAAARSEFETEIATTPMMLSEAYRLRHQVYCVERGYETSADGFETDAFDQSSQHVLLRRRSTREVVGTVRVVLPGRGPSASQHKMPMQKVCDPSVLRGLPLHRTGEISRFAISKDRRDGVGQAGMFMRLGLMQGIVRVSQEAGLTHWCAVMERSLIRLLGSTAIHFAPVGPTIEYHGIRQPAVARIAATLERIRQDAAPVFAYVTADGALWPAPAELLAA